MIDWSVNILNATGRELTANLEKKIYSQGLRLITTGLYPAVKDPVTSKTFSVWSSDLQKRKIRRLASVSQ